MEEFNESGGYSSEGLEGIPSNLSFGLGSSDYGKSGLSDDLGSLREEFERRKNE